MKERVSYSECASANLSRERLIADLTANSSMEIIYYFLFWVHVEEP